MIWCCCGWCGIWADTFALDWSPDYEQLAGEWTFSIGGSGYVATEGTGVLVLPREAPGDEAALLADVPTVVVGAVYRLGIGFDGSDYLWLEIEELGNSCVRLQLGGPGGTLTDPLIAPRPSQGFFVHYDGTWLHGGPAGTTNPYNGASLGFRTGRPYLSATTAGTGGTQAILAVIGTPPAEVRFRNLAFDAVPYDACFSIENDCGHPAAIGGSGSALYSAPVGQTSSDPPCYYSAASGSWPTLDLTPFAVNVPAELRGQPIVQAPATGTLVFGPHKFGGSEMLGAVGVLLAPGITTVRLAIGANAAGSGGTWIEASFDCPISGADGDLTAEIGGDASSPQVLGVCAAWRWATLAICDDGSGYVRASAGMLNAAAGQHALTDIPVDYQAAMCVAAGAGGAGQYLAFSISARPTQQLASDPVKLTAITALTYGVTEGAVHPAIPGGDGECISCEATDCRSCLGVTWSTATIALSGSLIAGTLGCDECEDIDGSYVLDVADGGPTAGGNCVWEKAFAWSMCSPFTVSAVTIRLTLKSNEVEVRVILTGTRPSFGDYTETYVFRNLPGYDPRDLCNSTFSCSYLSASSGTVGAGAPPFTMCAMPGSPISLTVDFA